MEVNKNFFNKKKIKNKTKTSMAQIFLEQNTFKVDDEGLTGIIQMCMMMMMMVIEFFVQMDDDGIT